MKKKLLFVITQLNKGGAETSLVTLLKQLDHKQYDVELLVLNQAPVAGTINLIPQVPKYVKVCDAYGAMPAGSVRSAFFQSEMFPQPAIRFVEGKTYDMAIHVGEWFPPKFLVTAVTARRKSVWIHTDINKFKLFDDLQYFAGIEQIDDFLFVSKLSMESACGKYPFLNGRSSLLHNALDTKAILAKAQKPSPRMHSGKRPVIVTVANIRVEKNHMRQLETMHLLKERGLDFEWWNIGFRSDKTLADTLEKKAAEFGLADRFLLLGADDNPYPYMMQADAVACLSDYESWSMVITEAKCLQKPVLATKTSGALEQIIDGSNGCLVDFNPRSIAHGLEKILFNKSYYRQLQQKMQQTPFKLDPAQELADLLRQPSHRRTERASLLYVIDDVNYPGGAHSATFRQILTLLDKGISVDIFSAVHPTAKLRKMLPDVNFYCYFSSPEYLTLKRRLLDCLLDLRMPKAEKKRRQESYLAFKHKDSTYLKREEQEYARQLFSQYQTVCVMSEGSMYKKALAQSTAKKKIQWIHTDYCSWRTISPATAALAAEDGETWKNVDQIVVLSECLKGDLVELYPHLEDKIIAIGNLLDEERIQALANKQTESSGVHFISVFRFAPEKNVMGILNVLHRLKKKSTLSTGPLLATARNTIRQRSPQRNMVWISMLLSWASSPTPTPGSGELMSTRSSPCMKDCPPPSMRHLSLARRYCPPMWALCATR